ncbi:MAG: MFS transporter [Actinomycetaceae bacterium]|nr:MFS transporter [Actinomycetaceae bacterium]
MTTQAVSLKARRARAGVTALFFTNGALFANFAPRFPELKDAFELSPEQYGLVLATFPLGAMIAGPFAAKLVNKLSSARLASYGTAVIAIMITLAAGLVGLAQGGGAILVLPFALLFFLGGGADAVVDVGQNAHGLRVQRLYGRSIINGFHAFWSLGAMTGGLMAMVAKALDVPIMYHIGFAGVFFTVMALVARRFTLPGPERSAEEEASESKVRVRAWSPTLVITMLLVLAIAGAMVEDIASAWSTLYMRDYIGAAPAVAPVAYVAMLAFHFLGRLTGDRFVERLGAKLTIRLGGLLMILGMGAAVFFQNPVVTVIAFALSGFGAATTVPLAMNAADDIEGLAPGVGLTIVSWLMRLTFLLVPPLVGALVSATSLLASIAVLPIAGVFIIASTIVLTDQAKAKQK